MGAAAPPPDRGTNHRPCLGVTSITTFTDHIETPQIFWKGVRDDSTVYASEFLEDWTPQEPLRQLGGTSHAPALAKVDVPGSVPLSAGLLMAWKGADDRGLYWTRNLGTGWNEPRRRVPNVGSSAGPALADFNDTIYMAWKGITGDRAAGFPPRSGPQQDRRPRSARTARSTSSPA